MPYGLTMSPNQSDLDKLIIDSTNFYECLFKSRMKIESRIADGSVSRTFTQKLCSYEQDMKENFIKDISLKIDNLIFYLGKSKCYQLITLRGYILEEFRIIRVCRYLSRSRVAFDFDSQKFLPVSDDYQLYNDVCQNLDTMSDSEIFKLECSNENEKKSSCSHQKFNPLAEDQQIWNEVIKSTFGDPYTDSHLDWSRRVKENYNPDLVNDNWDLQFPQNVFSPENESWFLS